MPKRINVIVARAKQAKTHNYFVAKGKEMWSIYMLYLVNIRYYTYVFKIYTIC